MLLSPQMGGLATNMAQNMDFWANLGKTRVSWLWAKPILYAKSSEFVVDFLNKMYLANILNQGIRHKIGYVRRMIS